MYKVLLVDDEPLCIEGLKLIVNWEEMGFELCGACNNGEEAMCKIKELSPQIVITDIRMPVMDGLSLIQQAKGLTANKPYFIILSGYGEFEYAKKAMEYGINHYILKPLMEEDIAEVLIQVRCLLDGEKRDKEVSRVDRRSVITDIFHKTILGVQLKTDVEKIKELLAEYSDESCWIYLHIRPKDNGNHQVDRTSDKKETYSDFSKNHNALNERMFLIMHDKNNYGIVLRTRWS